MVAARLTSAPEPNWAAIGPRGHGVQFYQSDERLVLLLGNFIGNALVTGGTAVVVATRPHRRSLSRWLCTHGLDIEAARAQGRFLVYDAAETLARFVVRGRIDRQAFADVAMEMVERAARTDEKTARVSAFGEMVSLLWHDGLFDTAIALEELWNEMLETRDVSLWCAYPTSLFAGQDDGASLLRICAQHSNIFPAEHRTRAVHRCL